MRKKVEVKNLTKRFGDLLVLNNLSFDVEEGDLLCVVGPTGCGKTTFLNSLTKIYDITEGEILLNGEPVNPKKQTLTTTAIPRDTLVRFETKNKIEI